MRMIIEHKSCARIELLGNPSDVYFGKTISLGLGNFWAEVKLKRSDELNIHPHPYHDLVKRLETEGYYRGVRLLMGICRVFWKHCKENKIYLHDQHFTLSYDTNVPRQVTTL